MHLRERTVIDRPAAEVWRHVAVAESFREWNEKITSLDASGPFRLGQRFTTQHALSGRATQFTSEVVALDEGRLLELRHAHPVGQGVDPRMEVSERVTLDALDARVAGGARTLVTKDVRVRHHGLPWWLLPVIWLVTRLGRPVGENRLKRMCEGTPDGRGA